MKLIIQENSLIAGYDDEASDTNTDEALKMFIKCMRRVTFQKTSIEAAILREAEKIKKRNKKKKK